MSQFNFSHWFLLKIIYLISVSGITRCSLSDTVISAGLTDSLLNYELTFECLKPLLLLEVNSPKH
jgi:hypothetical protein